MSPTDFTQRDTIRRNFGAGIIAGTGVEIGAGAFPQALPREATASHYDLRDADELRALFGTETIPVRPISDLPSDFPSGADFLIAHNVLEHAPDPIGELTRWNSCVRDGGVVVLSLPHYLYCPDERRRVPPLSHLIEDYINAVDGRDFVSREHGASFALGWWKDFCGGDRTTSVEAFSGIAFNNLAGERPDIHWHAFDPDLAIRTVISAAWLSGTRIELLRYWLPDLAQTVGDILIAYRIVERSGRCDDAATLARLNAERRMALDEAAGFVDREAQAAVKRQEPAGPKLRVFPLLKPFWKEGDFCFVAPAPAQLSACLEPHMKVTVTEDGRPLGPADGLHQLIRDQGGGAFSVWGANIYFSSSDRSDCNNNGRKYAIMAAER